ncbi:hypothetical protein M9H77_03826 [Catharanthus roseus]|uniref:Uncharacterized protein n=1 Tax=Catharanthus roseus TaxID=4058 RepID=A0ACC0CC94_CATRO|nr:hypothetical protein M9H77_03826 [Catharanthus roseus]
MTSVFRIPLSIPSPAERFSSLRTISSQDQVQFLTNKISYVSLTTASSPFFRPIRMGGGPRTYPGGVSKWQWKRMQAKKAKHLLKARLARERQIYEMRKRAELKAAVSELERPWEVVEKAPTIFSVSADEQLKVLADRFQRPGGFDMWSERDGPELFKHHGGLPSARFFPKGVVHSIKPYEKIEIDDGSEECENFGSDNEGEDIRERGLLRGDPFQEKGRVTRKINGEGNMNSLRQDNGGGKVMKSNIRKNNNKKRRTKDSAEIGLSNAERIPPPNNTVKENRAAKAKNSNLAVYDLNLQEDGSYGFQVENRR